MYRSTWEADRARIVALEQELADARTALAARDAEPASPTAQAVAQQDPGLTLALIFGGILLLNIVSFCVRTSQPAVDVDADVQSSPMQVLRDL